MAEYNIISQTLWNSEKFKSLKNDQFAKLLFLYLINSPHSNSCGCYVIHIGYMMADLNTDEKTIKDAIGKLIERLLIDYDYEENTVIIPNFFQYNTPRNPNHSIKVLNDILSIPCKKFKIIRSQEYATILKDKGWKINTEKKKILESLTQSLTPKLSISCTGYVTPNSTQPNSYIKKEDNKLSLKKEKKPSKKIIEIPEWIKAETWDLWTQHRKEIKKPLTPTSTKQQIKKLEDWRKQGHDPNEIIKGCILNGYQGLFLTTNQTKGKTDGSKNNVNTELQEFLDENRDQQSSNGSGFLL